MTHRHEALISIFFILFRTKPRSFLIIWTTSNSIQLLFFWDLENVCQKTMKNPRISNSQLLVSKRRLTLLKVFSGFRSLRLAQECIVWGSTNKNWWDWWADLWLWIVPEMWVRQDSVTYCRNYCEPVTWGWNQQWLLCIAWPGALLEGWRSQLCPYRSFYGLNRHY